MYNDSGNILAQLSGVDTYCCTTKLTGWTGCAGAYVRDFIFVNYNGVVSSNTESISNHTFC